jgi:aminoglycoside 3-N-acetyltransferase
MLNATSDILYLRAALKPLAQPIERAGGLLPFLLEHVAFTELLSPHFFSARPFWRGKPSSLSHRMTNSGALGKAIGSLPDSIRSQHPTHSFAGYGERVSRALMSHAGSRSCFHPLGQLADEYDFSMLLLGCLEESPGFSTVHVSQSRLGLSRRHLLRLALRWDEMRDGRRWSSMAYEAPGCSSSFDKFYPHYEEAGNLVRGEWYGVGWLFIPSARSALRTEAALLRKSGRFVDCEKWNCSTCRLRWY